MRAATTVGMVANPPLAAAELARGLVFGAWLFACDWLLKLVARAGACTVDAALVDSLSTAWSQPHTCTAFRLVGDAVVLLPAVRRLDPWGWLAPWFDPFLPVHAQLYGLGLVAVATVITIALLRWRWRSAGDAYALGTLWAGISAHALPRMTSGSSFTELQLFGFATGIADLAIAWACAWMLWRLWAEASA